MCGVAGSVGIADKNIAETALHKMMNRMVHRGPDSSGAFVQNGIALGHRRLKIIDLSSSADQPFVSKDGRYTMVFNGEIYNYQSIANELNGVQFQTASDTEVLLQAYIKWGKDCLSRLNGMFVFAVWDAQNESLFIARDRLGIKPLYYSQKEGTFVFASEIRALLASSLVAKKLDRNALREYLSYQTVHAPRTLIKGVSMLMPGHYMTISGNEVCTERYWHPVKERIVDVDRLNSKTGIRDTLLQAVQRRMIADVPLGAFLSGGIDSSAIVGLMAELSSDPIHTFSVVFDDKAFSEEEYADIIAKKFATKHTTLRLHSSELLKSLPAVLSAIDHPSVDGPNTYIVSQATKNAGITVAMSGLGGDELFAGYPVFQQLPRMLDNRLMSLPIALRSIGSSLGKTVVRSAKGKKALGMLAERNRVDALYPHFRKAMDNGMVNKLLNTSNESSESQVFASIFSENETLDSSFELLSSISSAEIQTYMQNVLLRDADQMSMAHALEIRVPFLDHELVQLAMGLSDQAKHPSYPKRSLVEGLEGLLPDEIVHRKKMGFTFPWRHWLQNEMRETCRVAINSLKKYDMFNSKGLDSLWIAFESGSTSVNWTHIWSLVVLSSWMSEINIED